MLSVERYARLVYTPLRDAVSSTFEARREGLKYSTPGDSRLKYWDNGDTIANASQAASDFETLVMKASYLEQAPSVSIDDSSG